MQAYEPKKLLILRILEILTEYSDCDHKLRQADVITYLKSRYGIECERKAVARNIEYLQRAGYDIVTDGTGCYLACKKFEPGELRLLIDSVLSNRNVCKTHTKQLIEKLTLEGGKHFKSYARHVVNLDDWQKDDNYEYFYDIELLCEAIEKNRQITFGYNSYGADKKLHPRRESGYCASPYQLFLKNGRYYVAVCFANHDNLAYCRVDRMTDIRVTGKACKPLSEVKGHEKGINLGRLNKTMPYLYEEEPTRIEFITANGAENMIDNVIDWFGTDVQITELSDGNYKFSLNASPRAMRFWILQYGKFVKVLAPQSLADQIKDDINQMKKLYED